MCHLFVKGALLFCRVEGEIELAFENGDELMRVTADPMDDICLHGEWGRAMTGAIIDWLTCSSHRL